MSIVSPAFAQPHEKIFRVARRNAVLGFSWITPTDAALPKAGNRFDVPGGGVLYAATDPQCCYSETLARYRPTPKMREIVGEQEPGFMVTGGVPQDWRLARVKAVLKLESPLPFLDVDHPATLQFLSEELAQDLVALGYDGENLDFSDVCNRDRRLSRRIAQYAYTALEGSGEHLYSGIRYLSRLNPRHECWAVFDGTEIREVSTTAIELTDPDLIAVADLWGLRLF